jgi:tRNA pseudouridine-54 N-methylase
MDRFLKTYQLRDLEKKVINEEITYSKLIEELNKMAYVYYMIKKGEDVIKD